MAPPRIAVCQDWVMTWSGSDKVAGRLAHVLGASDVYTFAGRPDLLKRAFPNASVHTSRLGQSSFGQRHWGWLLPAMAAWWRSIDLSPFDLVVTSSHAAVNAIRVRPGAQHVCYCHTPMRYAWQPDAEIGRFPAILRPVWGPAAAALRRTDRGRASNVDVFVANSRGVKDRITSAYGRSSTVVYPPVATDFFTVDRSVRREDFFLWAGRLVAYKRPDVAVEAAHRAGVRLVVAGSGPELPRVRSMAGDDVSFVEQPTDLELRDLYQRARALVVPGFEDFGMVMIEAQACGTPVIALAAGGALEAVDRRSGALYEDPSAEGLASALREWRGELEPSESARRWAEAFRVERFDAEITSLIDDVLRDTQMEMC